MVVVKHHFLDHRSRFSVQIGQLRILRVDLGGVDRRGADDDGVPPGLLVELLEMNRDFFPVV